MGLGIYVNVYAHMQYYRGQKRASDLLNVGVTDMNHRMGVGNTGLLQEQCSNPLCYFSNP